MAPYQTRTRIVSTRQNRAWPAEGWACELPLEDRGVAARFSWPPGSEPGGKAAPGWIRNQGQSAGTSTSVE